jgi:hypothetical protein
VDTYPNGVADTDTHTATQRDAIYHTGRLAHGVR